MRASLSTAQLSDLIGLIYDAAIDPSGWPIAIEAIRSALDFTNAAFSLQAFPSGEVLVNVTSNIPQSYLDRMAGYGSEILEVWGGAEVLVALPMDEPAVLSHVNPVAVQFELTTNRYSLEWARPQGIIDAMALGLARDEGGLGSLGLGRHESAGPIGPYEIETARLLLPHLQRAATINRLLDIAAVARSTFEAALDTLAAPIFITTADLEIVHANPAAQDMIASGDLLHARNGVLGARVPAVASALAVAVSQAAQDESAIGRKGLSVPIRWQDGSVGAVHVLPLRPGRTTLGAVAVAALFVARADTPFIAQTGLIAALFGLTPAEGRVFELIVEGRTVTETSDALGVERSTVRTHLLRLFEKTGAKRQADLVQLAASLAAPVALGI